MQTGKNAAASVKETAANVAASAKSGMEKAKASAQEKVTLSFALFFPFGFHASKIPHTYYMW